MVWDNESIHGALRSPWANIDSRFALPPRHPGQQHPCKLRLNKLFVDYMCAFVHRRQTVVQSNRSYARRRQTREHPDIYGALVRFKCDGRNLHEKCDTILGLNGNKKVD